MTVSGILSGLLNPSGLGYSLSRAAARLQPIQANGSIPESEQGRILSPPLVDQQSFDTSWYNTHDTVELSPAAEREGQGSLAVGTNGQQLTEQELTRLSELKARDREVRRL